MIQGLLGRVLPGFVLRFAQGLRFPQLFLLAAALFLLDMIVPDAIPFADEILLGIVTLILGSLGGKQDQAGRVHEGEARRVD